MTLTLIFHFSMDSEPSGCLISTNCNNDGIKKPMGIWQVRFLKINVSVLSRQILLYFCVFLTPCYMQRSDPKSLCRVNENLGMNGSKQYVIQLPVRDRRQSSLLKSLLILTELNRINPPPPSPPEIIRKFGGDP